MFAVLRTPNVAASADGHAGGGPQIVYKMALESVIVDECWQEVTAHRQGRLPVFDPIARGGIMGDQNEGSGLALRAPRSSCVAALADDERFDELLMTGRAVVPMGECRRTHNPSPYGPCQHGLHEPTELEQSDADRIVGFGSPRFSDVVSSQCGFAAIALLPTGRLFIC